MKEVRDFKEVDKGTLILMLLTKAINDLNAEIMMGTDDDAVKIARVNANNKLLADIKQ